jgi:cell division protein FtsB
MSTTKKRPAKLVQSVFRITRNVLAVLGVCFVYLLITGVMQYEDRLAAGDTTCTLTHCV